MADETMYMMECNPAALRRHAATIGERCPEVGISSFSIPNAPDETHLEPWAQVGWYSVGEIDSQLPGFGFDRP